MPFSSISGSVAIEGLKDTRVSGVEVVLSFLLNLFCDFTIHCIVEDRLQS